MNSSIVFLLLVNIASVVVSFPTYEVTFCRTLRTKFQHFRETNLQLILSMEMIISLIGPDKVEMKAEDFRSNHLAAITTTATAMQMDSIKEDDLLGD